VRRPHAASFDLPRDVLLRRDSQAGGRLTSSSRPRVAMTRPYAETATAPPRSCGQVLQRYWQAPRAPLDAAVSRAHSDRFAESAPRQDDAPRRRTRPSTSTPRGCDGGASPRDCQKQASCQLAPARPRSPRQAPLALLAPPGLARPRSPHHRASTLASDSLHSRSA